MTSRRIAAIAAALLMAVSAGYLIAREEAAKPAGSGRPEDEKAIRAASQAFAKAFESGDAGKVAALFTENAEYLEHRGEPIRGREALAKAYAGFFESRKAVKADSKTEALRFLGTDLAVEEGTFTVTPKDGVPVASHFSSLYVREGGKWQIALLKEWEGAVVSKPKLDDLAWLIGTWQSQGSELTSRTTYEWTANKAFLRAQYAITPKKEGEAPRTGTQVIGIDPAVGLIRAWQFDSEGGIGESTWVWDGSRWMIESIATLADGRRTTAINFLAPSGKDSFSWKSVQRTTGGAAQPDLGPVMAKRVAAEK